MSTTDDTVRGGADRCRIIVLIEELRKEPTEAEIILRMGGLANAALVMGRALISEYRPGSPIPPFTV